LRWLGSSESSDLEGEKKNDLVCGVRREEARDRETVCGCGDDVRCL